MNGILTMGEVMGLFLSDQVGRITPGSLMRTSVAGSEFNVAAALSRLQVPTSCAGTVGNDLVGPMVRNVLQGEGVDDVRFLEMLSGYRMGFMIKERYGQREPRVHYYRRHTAMHQRAVPAGMAAAVGEGWVHLSGITLMIDDNLRHRIEKGLTGWTEQQSGSLSIDLNVRRRLGHGAAETECVRDGIAFRGDLVDLWDTDEVSLLVENGTFKPDHVVIVTDGPRGSWLSIKGARELSRCQSSPSRAWLTWSAPGTALWRGCWPVDSQGGIGTSH